MQNLEWQNRRPVFRDCGHKAEAAVRGDRPPAEPESQPIQILRSRRRPEVFHDSSGAIAVWGRMVKPNFFKKKLSQKTKFFKNNNFFPSIFS